MERYCATCRRNRPLRDFDLNDALVVDVVECRSCAGGHSRAEDRRAREQQIAALERQRRSLIASLVKIDAEIAALREAPRTAPFDRVDPAVVDSSDGFGD